MCRFLVAVVFDIFSRYDVYILNAIVTLPPFSESRHNLFIDKLQLLDVTGPIEDVRELEMRSFTECVKTY